MGPIPGFETIVGRNEGSSLLPPGGYICRIIRVVDHTMDNGAKPYLRVVFDVFDQSTRTFLYAEQSKDPEQDWRHCIDFYLSSDFGLARYKALTEAVEKSQANNGFKYMNVQDGEQALVGKWVGFVINHRLYTGKDKDGRPKDKTQINLAAAISTDDIAAGNFEVPANRDDRVQADPHASTTYAEPAQEAQQQVADDPLPF